jgi:hypothetical protein
MQHVEILHGFWGQIYLLRVATGLHLDVCIVGTKLVLGETPGLFHSVTTVAGGGWTVCRLKSGCVLRPQKAATPSCAVGSAHEQNPHSLLVHNLQLLNRQYNPKMVASQNFSMESFYSELTMLSDTAAIIMMLKWPPMLMQPMAAIPKWFTHQLKSPSTWNCFCHDAVTWHCHP